MTQRIDVGVLGATGTVGRCLVGLLHDHPWFRLTEVGASPESAGLPYGDVALDSHELPEEFSGLVLKSVDEEWRSPLLLSAIPGIAAGPVEVQFAQRGHLIVSNASAHRTDPGVPLIIPEVNADHIALVATQRERWPGGLITNPNCSVVGLAMALAPLHKAFGVESVVVATLQSISGAGRPGPGAAELLDNVIPDIPGEERKISEEPRKILGRLVDERIEPAAFTVSALVHRVPVLHGHMMAVSIKLDDAASMDQIHGTLEGFTGAIVEERLPSSPTRPIRVLKQEARPQPRLDRDAGDGMVVSVGRIRPCEALDVKFSVLVHNLVRGAAGAALLNAELSYVCGVTARLTAG